jgi:hypothetical protein
MWIVFILLRRRLLTDFLNTTLHFRVPKEEENFLNNIPTITFSKKFLFSGSCYEDQIIARTEEMGDWVTPYVPSV